MTGPDNGLRRRRRYGSLLVAFALGGLVLVGCGDDDDDNGNGNGNGAQPTATAPAAVVTEPPTTEGTPAGTPEAEAAPTSQTLPPPTT